jgi:hypothetical protein
MCEDYPCCGHDVCPEFDASGRLKCVCGATLPLDSRYSICDTCMNSESDLHYLEEYLEENDEEARVLADQIRKGHHIRSW